MSLQMPPMPTRILSVRSATGPADIVCKSNGKGGPGCGLYLACVISRPIVKSEDLSEIIGGVERWECWNCWRAVEVRFGPDFEDKEIADCVC